MNNIQPTIQDMYKAQYPIFEVCKALDGALLGGLGDTISLPRDIVCAALFHLEDIMAMVKREEIIGPVTKEEVLQMIKPPNWDMTQEHYDMFYDRLVELRAQGKIPGAHTPENRIWDEIHSTPIDWEKNPVNRCTQLRDDIAARKEEIRPVTKAEVLQMIKDNK